MKASAVAKNMIRTICLLTLGIIVAGAVYYRSVAAVHFALGALMGGALNIYKVFALERTVEKALDMDSARAANHIRIQSLIRFVLTGLVLAAGALCPFLSLWGAAAGVFTLKIAAFCTKFYFDREGGSAGDNAYHGPDTPI